MLDWFDNAMRSQPLLVFSLVVASGYLIGKIRIRDLELGGVSGVLFAALVFGHFGYEGSATLQTLGFVAFMYVVGFEAGPQFFAVFLKDGFRYLVLSLAVAATGLVAATLLGRLFELPPGAAAGVLAGGMTTTPTLAAAQDAVTSGQVVLPDGVAADDVVGAIGAAYAITYLFGLLGMIGVIKLAPKLLRIDLAADAAEIEAASGDRSARRTEPIRTRAYRILEGYPGVGRTRAQIEEDEDRKVRIERVRRGGEFVDLTDDLIIEAGDEVAVVGFLSRLRLAGGYSLEEIDDPDLIDLGTESAWIVISRRLVARKQVAGASLEELGVQWRFGVFVQEVMRQGVHIEPTPALRLQRGDVLSVTGPAPHLAALGRHVGHLERDIEQTDLITYMLGTAMGLLLGSLTLVIAGVPIGLGLAGGLLVVGLVIGFLRSIYPTFGRVPAAVRWSCMELGLLFFMAGVGLQAGESIVETLRSAGFALFVSGAIVTILPMAVGWIVGRSLLRIRPSMLMGAITGAMTNTACLKLVRDEARSSVPALGYTGAYAFANVILAVAGSIIVRLTV